MTPDSNRPETPNHALPRTGSAVTAPAADHRHLSAHRQVPRPLRLSLSLGSLGVATRVPWMTIDEQTGCIALPEVGAFISPSLSRSVFLQTPAFSGAAVSVANEPWCSYTLPSIAQPETELFITFQFHGQRLLSLSLMHGAARFGSSWADWSEERELARRSFHERWLVRELGVHLGDYSWGSISAHYDSKGGFSSINVQYANRNA